MDEHDVREDVQDVTQGDAQENALSPQQKKKKSRVRILLTLLLVLILLLTPFLALRAWAVYMMDNWPYFATKQGRSLASDTTFATLDGHEKNAAYSYDIEAEGFEIKATLELDYGIYSDDLYISDSIGHVITEYYRFDNAKHAEAFLAELGEEEGRYRYALGKYVFDRPVYTEEEGLMQEEVRTSYRATLGEFLYYLFVEFKAPIIPGSQLSQESKS